MKTPPRYIFKLLRHLFSFRNYCKERLSVNAIFLLLSIVIGVSAGAAATALKWLVKLISRGLTYFVRYPDSNYLLLIYPLAGILLTYILCRYIFRRKLENCTSQVKHALSRGHYHLPAPLCYIVVIANAITLGFGGSAGGEGPIAFTGAAIGSNVGRIFGLSTQHLRAALAIGAGAGIAGIFKSPVGGMLFTIEVLHVQLSTLGVISLIFACIVAAMTCYGGTGFRPDIIFSDKVPFDSHLIGWIIIFGICCGLYSIYYAYTKEKFDKFLHKIENPWKKALTAGSFLSLFIFLIPSFYGEGYDIIARVINGGEATTLIHSPLYMETAEAPWLPLVAIGIILLLKGMMVSATVSGGGVAGEFAPTLFAGAMAGYFFASIMNSCFGMTLPVQNFALMGMAAAMAGILHAPLMAMFITAEMTCGYLYMMGIFLAASFSYLMVKIITPHSFWRQASHDDIHALQHYGSESIAPDHTGDRHYS